VSTAAEYAPRRVGDDWVTHRELAALEGLGLTDCEGTLLVADTSRPNLFELACDGCAFTLGVRPAELASTVETRPDRWWDLP
jgi:hypothetical protein